MIDAQTPDRTLSGWIEDTSGWPLSPPPPSDDAELLARMAGGDEAALGRLYDRHAGLVLGLLTRMLGAGGVAEEVMQEVFLQVWRQAERYRQDLATPRGWLLMIARSRALDRLKASAASRRREEAMMEEISECEPPLGSARLEQAERAAEVRKALAELPVEQRQALELAFFAGLSHRQIALRLGTPLGTVKSRVLLGMKKLRQALVGLVEVERWAVN